MCKLKFKSCMDSSFYVCRFRGYFQALMSSAKVLFCHPRSLFQRSDSKSSLDIGVRPIRPMYAGVVRMEMHNINNHHSPLTRRSNPQHLVNGTKNKTATKGNICLNLYQTRKYPLRGYILGVLTHTTAWDQLWGGDIF